MHNFSFLVTMCIYINTEYWPERSFKLINVAFGKNISEALKSFSDLFGNFSFIPTTTLVYHGMCRSHIKEEVQTTCRLSKITVPLVNTRYLNVSGYHSNLHVMLTKSLIFYRVSSLSFLVIRLLLYTAFFDESTVLY